MSNTQIIFICFLSSLMGGLISGMVLSLFHRINLKYIEERLKIQFEYISEAWKACIEIKSKELRDILEEDHRP